MEAHLWSLRPAVAEDEEFLKALFAKTDGMLKALPAALQVTLSEMQYRGRQLSYSALYPKAQDSIICVEDGSLAGRVWVDRREDHFRVIDVAILPEWQGRGVGTSVLEDLAQQARDAGVEIRLRVYQDNPAVRLYLRLGFVVTSSDQMSCEMTICTFAGTNPHSSH